MRLDTVYFRGKFNREAKRKKNVGDKFKRNKITRRFGNKSETKVKEVKFDQFMSMMSEIMSETVENGNKIKNCRINLKKRKGWISIY